MAEEQVIYPVRRLLANPRIFHAIAGFFEDGPEWEVFADAFYDLLESEIMEEEDMEDQVGFEAPEVCFRRSPEDEEVFQVILATGTAMELRPQSESSDGRRYGLVSSEDELGVTGAIYGRLVKAIEEVRPDLAGNIALCSPPTAANGFLRSENGENFAGEFHLLSDPSQLFTYTVDVVDLSNDELKATVKRK
jgi:hypothetical protein